MAKATGFTCDHRPCSKFMVGEALPDGWLVLRVNVNEGAGSAVSRTTFELCSNFCLAELAIARADADGTPVSKKSLPRWRSPESLAAAQRNGRRTGHKRSHVDKGVLDPDCEFCQELTAPATA